MKIHVVFPLILLFCLVTAPTQSELATVWGYENGSSIQYNRLETITYPKSWGVQNETYNQAFNITFIEFSQDGYKFEYRDPLNTTTAITLFKAFDFLGGNDAILPIIGYPFLLPLAIYNANDYVNTYFEQWQVFAKFIQSQIDQALGANTTETPGFSFSITKNNTVKSLYFSFYQPNITLSTLPSDTFFGNFSLSHLNLTRVSPFNTSLTLFTDIITTYSFSYEINTGVLLKNEFEIHAQGWKLITQENATNEEFHEYLIFSRSSGNEGVSIATYTFGYYPLYLTLLLIILPVIYYGFGFLKHR